nr:putative zinc-binding metallopeptidase [Alteromonas ponticola]
MWYRMELAKRRLLYTLKKLGLPVWRPIPDKPPLRFRFLEDVKEDKYGNELTVKSTIITGHNNGVITLNLREAEDASRVLMREKMNERYRTLIGHFRHESGHFYWDVLIQNSPWQQSFRDLFGDENIDYMQSLEAYYKSGPPANWQENYISAYASMHPWEDWAETWAHYLHIVDTLETATEYEVALLGYETVNPLTNNGAANPEFDVVYEDWCRLTTVLNALNRSMGLDDAYPFVISDRALLKLRFVHDIVQKQLSA